MRPVLIAAVLLFAIHAFSQAPPAWVVKSNQNTQLLIDIDAKYQPEGAAAEGVKGLDDQIFSLAPDINERQRADLRKAKQELERRLGAEKDPLVKQDLQILIGSADKDIRASET